MIKRLIGVVTIKEDWVVQSFRFNEYLPLGRPETVVENLDRWQLDEILILNIDRTTSNLGPNFSLLEKLGDLGITTPLSYMGGVRKVSDAIDLLKCGADRIGIENLFNENLNEVRAISDAIGKQAVIRGLSVYLQANRLMCIAKDGSMFPVSVKELESSQAFYSELLLIDRCGDGLPLAFDQNLLTPLTSSFQIICFGGISSVSQVKYLLSRDSISAVAVGNFLNYSELANLNFIDDSSRYEFRDIDYGETSQGALDW